MRILFKVALVAVSLAGTAACHAAAYKCEDEKGRTVYSDIPCPKKAPPPAPKVDPAKAAALAAEPPPLAKLTEADVLRVLTLSEDYTRANNHAELCNLFAADMKFQANNQVQTPPRVLSGGREQACQAGRENAEASKRTGLITLIERGPTKVSIEPGEARATATYDSVVKLTRYDRIVSTYRCSSKDQVGLYAGKALLSATDGTCKP